MSNLISSASGNWSAASTWRVAATGSGAVLVSRTHIQPVNGQLSSKFAVTKGEIINGIMVHLEKISSQGTITVSLAGGPVDLTSKTINVSTLPDGKSWILFAIPALVSNGNQIYSIRLKTSIENTVNAYTDGIENNWSHILRTSSTAIPAMGDNLWVVGEQVGIEKEQSFTVIMDMIASPGYGKIEINNGGTLSFATEESKDYILTTTEDSKGGLEIFAGGAFTIGTPDKPIPATSSAELYFNGESDGNIFMQVWKNGTFKTCGQPKHLVEKLKEDSDVKSLCSKLDSNPIGWKKNDIIVFSPTVRNIFQCEAKTLSDDVTDSLIYHGPKQLAHDGGKRTSGEVLNLTQHIKIHGTASTINTRLEFNEGAIVNCNTTEFYFIGSQNSADAGIMLMPAKCNTVNSISFYLCSFRDSTNIFNCGAFMSGLSVSSCVAFNIMSFFNCATSATTVQSLLVNTIVKSTSTAISTNAQNKLVGNTVSGCTETAYLITGSGKLASFENNSAHSNSIGIKLDSFSGNGSIVGGLLWRNIDNGILLNGAVEGLVVSEVGIFGNLNNITLDKVINTKFINCSVDSDLKARSDLSIGMKNYLINTTFENCAFGATSPAAIDFDILSGTGTTIRSGFRNCSFTAPVKVNNLTSQCKLFSQNHNQIVGSDFEWTKYGTLQEDTSKAKKFVFGNGSSKINPFIKNEIPVAKARVNSGETVSFKISLRKSTSTDGAAYNGNQPRLIVKANSNLGFVSDKVLAVASSAHDGKFAVLSGTTAPTINDGLVEFVVDCDGSDGWITVDGPEFLIN
jgi:hypothetical protein